MLVPVYHSILNGLLNRNYKSHSLFIAKLAIKPKSDRKWFGKSRLDPYRDLKNYMIRKP